MVDHCRIGSLEKVAFVPATVDDDHCRIGSLEIDKPSKYLSSEDHCRIGSLEMSDSLGGGVIC